MPPPDTPALRCHVLDTGYCTASEHHLIRGGRRRTLVIHSVAALLQHPQYGWFLWDAGYAPRLLDATRRLPFRLYRWATPMHVRPELAVAAQLARFGLEPRDVRRVVVSHFHADHVAGLRDFPHAELIALRAAYEDVAGRRGLRALAAAFVPALMPDDFDRRATLLPPLAGPPLGPLGPPHRLTHFFIDDPAAMHRTLDRLHDFAAANPDVAVAPSHCPEAFARHVESAAGG